MNSSQPNQYIVELMPKLFAWVFGLLQMIAVGYIAYIGSKVDSMSSKVDQMTGSYPSDMRSINQRQDSFDRRQDRFDERLGRVETR